VGEASKGDKRRVLALVPDLIDRSRIEPVAASAGASIRFVDNLASLRPRDNEQWELVIVDLDAPDAMSAISAVRGCRIIGFGSHVNRDRLDAARQAGYDEVVTRSMLFRRLPALIGDLG
jgi:hypothetical protein